MHISPTCQDLKELEFAQADSLPQEVRLRVHRAISWLECASQQTNNSDAAFIFYWVSFNSLYVQERETFDQHNERSIFADYFETVTSLDTKDEIYDALWARFSNSIHPLLNNRYIYQPFWNKAEDWEKKFEKDKKRIKFALARNDTKTVLTAVFDRLYVLRNQLFHGGATWQGKVNRSQVKDGVRIMEFIVPILIHQMLMHPNNDWGYPPFPVIEG